MLSRVVSHPVAHQTRSGFIPGTINGRADTEPLPRAMWGGGRHPGGRAHGRDLADGVRLLRAGALPGAYFGKHPGVRHGAILLSTNPVAAICILAAL